MIFLTRHRICDVIRWQHKALATEETYVFWLRRVA
jgi:hypothetical protein